MGDPVMNKHGMPLEFTPAEPRPEDGAKLAEDFIDYCREYARVGEDQYIVFPAWVLHCHAFSAFTRTPYLNATSPMPDCGKTQFLEITALVVPDPMMASSCTDAVLSRSINEDRPVLMVDEFDQLQAGDKELLAAILATVNSGYKKSGCRYILEPIKGGGWQRKKLSTFCPKILSGISSLPATTKTRCVPWPMERLAPGDHVSDPDEYIIEPQAAKLFARAARWAAQHRDQIAAARPDSPQALRNRQREVSRPLFAIADAIGGKWPEMVRAAVVRLFATVNAAPADDVKVELLASIREVFGDRDRIASIDLEQALRAMEEKPWATWGRGKGITQHQISRMLKDFKVPATKSTRLDDGRNLKAYEREWFERIWATYLPHTGDQLVTSSQPALTLVETQISSRHNNSNVTNQKREKPASLLHCDDVTTQKPERGMAASKSNGRDHVFCYKHPLNTGKWWKRPDGSWTCGKCYPERAAIEEFEG
jgi:hypothetical protein